jgi:hypothetical protein
MNEELKIIISAVADPAKKTIQEVKKELNEVDKTGKEAGNSTSSAMSKVAKGAAIAAAAVTAVVTAMVALGNKANEVNKGISKLNSAFRNSGSSAKQATQYYKELFGVLGDHDRAVETGQSLARITTDEGALNDYKNIIAGAVSQYGDGYNSEALSENISETIAAAKVTGDLERVLAEAGISADGFNAALQETNSLEERELLVRQVLNGVLGNAGKAYIAANQATIAYNQAQANLNIALASAAAYTTPFLTAITNLGSNLLTALSPALQTVSIYLTAFIQLISQAIQWVGSFFGMFGGKTEKVKSDVSGYKDAMKKYLNSLKSSFNQNADDLDKNISKVKELKKQTMGFDELNVVGSDTAAASGGDIGGGGSGFKIPALDIPDPSDYGLDGDFSGLKDITKDIEAATEKIKSLLPLIALAAIGFTAWKIIDLIKTIKNAKKLISGMEDGALHKKIFGENAEKYLGDLKTKLLGVVGVAMMIAGALLLVWGWSDAWVNGLDWGNFVAILGGLALIVGGIALKFGGIAAPIALVVAGVVALVIGIKDLITNGYSMQGVLMVLAGVIAIGIGLIWAFNAALLANPITWIIVAVLALGAAFVILWNECEGFRKFWINLGDWLKNFFTVTVPHLFNKFLEFWAKLWEGAKTVFFAVWDWIKNFFTVTIPSIFNTVINFVKENWQGLLLLLVNPFAAGFKLLYDNCDSFRAFIDKWVGKIGQFFVDLWQGIQNTFSSVGKFFKDVFSKAWQGVLGVFSAGGKVFDGIKQGIVSTFKTVVNAIITGINKVVKLPFESLNKILDKIHKLKIAGIKPFDWLTWRAPIPQLPKLAKGGIATAPTAAIFGEAGKEAILPLENNTGWIDMLADRINARNAAPSKIVLMVGERELGYAAINSINEITQQTGSLQLKLI